MGFLYGLLIVIGFILWILLLVAYPDTIKFFQGIMMMILGVGLISCSEGNMLVLLVGLGLFFFSFIVFSSTKWWKNRSR